MNLPSGGEQYCRLYTGPNRSRRCRRALRCGGTRRVRREAAERSTLNGARLSAIGIAGIDRMVQANVIAMSGKAVETAGNIDVLLLDKTGTITLGNRQATSFIPADDVSQRTLADACQLASLADETPEGRSIVILAKEQYGLRARDIHELGAAFVPFTAQTRMSGVNSNGTDIRKGSADAIEADVTAREGRCSSAIQSHVDVRTAESSGPR